MEIVAVIINRIFIKHSPLDIKLALIGIRLIPEFFGVIFKISY